MAEHPSVVHSILIEVREELLAPGAHDVSLVMLVTNQYQSSLLRA